MISGRGSPPASQAISRSLEDRPRLHGDQTGYDQSETHTAQTQHRVLLVRRTHGSKEPTLGGVGLASLVVDGHLDGELVEVGQELVQGWVDQPDRDRQHRPSRRGSG